MKIDLYTKGVLTVIAFALIVMVFKDVDPISTAYANGNCATYNQLLDVKNEIVENIIMYSSPR